MSSYNFAASPQGLGCVLQHYLLFFTTFQCCVLDLHDPSAQALAGLQGPNPQRTKLKGSALFQSSFEHRDMTQRHGQKGMGARLVFYFPSKETNHLAWNFLPGLVRRPVPLC